MIDLRSDTVTKPGKSMLQAMFEAPVGDDVLCEDPSINALEKLAANMFDMQAALFCPSGTMTNQIAIKIHTKPGDEIICHELSHIYQYEGGGIAFNSGCSTKLITGNYGKIQAQQVFAGINNTEDVHKAFTSLVSLENTSNRGGGGCYNFEEIEKIKQVCVDNNLKLHLDGARLFNALIAKNETPKQYGKTFDSISICLSKSLGAPVGSLLLGTTPFIKQARRIRKVFGGGMRQAGSLAAAGLYALQNNIQLLQNDHNNAKHIANLLTQKNWVKSIMPVETNIVIFDMMDENNAKKIHQKLTEQNVLCYLIAPTQIRFVFHLDISDDMMNKLEEVIIKL